MGGDIALGTALGIAIEEMIEFADQIEQAIAVEKALCAAAIGVDQEHLLIDWRHGEQWFWDTLVDGDPAANPAQWQWVAGTGADAAPYFRIFNPILQAQKFDPDGSYIHRYVPELKTLPPKYLSAPWQAPTEVLEKAGVELGKTYPTPVVDHQSARNRALDALKYLNSNGPDA